MKTLVYILLFLMIMVSCKSPQYLAEPENFRYHTRGLFLEYEKSKKVTILGEIIEVKDQSIFILPVEATAPALMEIPRKDLKNADIIISLTSDKPKAISTWAGLLNIPLPSPLHLAVTIPIANDAAKGTYRMKYPDDVSWNELYKFARFPQGIPENIDRRTIR